ncbi:MAG: tRNA (N(6)-L-threonylcarbamoyladenosine(37)-C(2))-methylthiotransferase MtaB [Candidatus Margulisiibacteriota bacterium]|jgi:threonylcarbamoyladenosine tRNA methylthiotransferase MtaB
MPTIAIHTLGCKVNQADSEKLRDKFLQNGYVEVPFNGPADLYLINTCSVTNIAERKSRQFVAKAHKQNPEAQIVMAGCYVRLNREKVLGIPGVTGVIDDAGTVVSRKNTGTQEGKNSEFIIQNSEDAKITSPLCQPQRLGGEGLGERSKQRVRRFLILQTGCEQFCAYCIIPMARGKCWSKPLAEAIREAEKMIKEEGAKEIVLTGINLGTYQPSLAEAVRALCKLPSLLRMRLSSVEPQYWTEELLKTIETEPKVCKHFHIPLQSGSANVLKNMQRPYSLEKYHELIASIYERFPLAAVTTDVIVGFPGETEADFAKCCEFIRQQNFAKVHIFKYSARSGTAAAKMPEQINETTKQKRMDILQKIDSELEQKYHDKFLGQKLEVLWESYESKTGKLNGLTVNYLRVKTKGNKELVGKITSIHL